MTKKNALIKNITLTFKRRKSKKAEGLKNLTKETASHSKRHDKTHKAAEVAAKQVKKLKADVREIEKSLFQACRAEEKKRERQNDLKRKQKKEAMKEQKYKYYARKRKENDKKLKASMSKEEWDNLVRKREKIKDTFWHTQRDKSHEAVLGRRIRNKNDHFVNDVNSTDDEMIRIDNEIDIMNREDEERKDNDTALHQALEGYFPVVNETNIDMNDTDVLTDCVREVNCTIR